MRVMILGGYGAFGSRISQRLAFDATLEVIIAGRSQAKADALRSQILTTRPYARVVTYSIALHDEKQLTIALQQLRPALVINTLGPFQGQNYMLAAAVIRQGIHYLDLADARDYVCGFNQLDTLAKQHKVLAVTGVSTVPGLSTAVLEHFIPQFSSLQSVDIGISPGNRAPRGLATIRSVLSYCGKSFLRLTQRNWQPVYGWQGLQRHRYPAPVGSRWLSDCDVPDHVLIPQRFPQLRNLRFRAGLELSILHLPIWLMSWLTRWSLIRDWSHYARVLQRMSLWFYRFGSDAGAMHVTMHGLDQQQAEQSITWHMLACHGDGPQIPCTAAIILAKKLAQQGPIQSGAMPCQGLFTLKEFMDELRDYSITQHISLTQHQCALSAARTNTSTMPRTKPTTISVASSSAKL